MDEIKVVIDISKHEWEYLNKLVKNGDQLGHYERLLVNGTPLPKGHGRLGDLDKIQSMARKKAEDCFPEGRYDYGYRKALFDFAKDIDDAPTIIEADKEE